jgi:hypothetical protein
LIYEGDSAENCVDFDSLNVAGDTRFFADIREVCRGTWRGIFNECGRELKSRGLCPVAAERQRGNRVKGSVAFCYEGQFVPDFLLAMLLVLTPSFLMIAWLLWRSKGDSTRERDF